MPIRRSLVALLASAVCFFAAVVMAWHHPLSPALNLALLCIWCCLVAWQPRCWLWVVPACLPWMNFSSWSGWLVFEEFDIVLLGALAGGYARLACLPRGGAVARHQAVPAALVLLLACSGVVALWRGLADAGGFRFDWFAGYSDALNSWRVFKSLGLSLLFLPLLRWHVANSAKTTQADLALGIVLGLALTSVAVLWERAAFPGIADFSAHYRTVALFWEMHVGGAAIDVYLALTASFVVWALLVVQHPRTWMPVAALAILAVYACLTTFSRGVYLATAAPLGVLTGLLWWQKSMRRPRGIWQWLENLGRWVGWRRKASTYLLVALGLEVLVVLEGGTFMSERMASAQRDLGSRMAHWQQGLGLLHSTHDWTLGLGLGRLPAHYAAQVPGGEFSGSVQWHAPVRRDSGDRAFVRLQGPATQEDLGGLFELTQRVSVAQRGLHRVDLRLRVKTPTRLGLYLCERHLLYDRACQGATLIVNPVLVETGFGWQTLSVTLRGPSLADAPWYAHRLKMFSLSVPEVGGRVDIDRVSLTNSTGLDMLDNGDFEAGMAHWVGAAQSYFDPWHLDNLFLETLVERGWFGLLSLMALMAWVLWHLTVGRARLQPLAPYLAAALLAALLVGLVSSVMDVPRVAFLFYLLIFVSMELTTSEFCHGEKGKP